MRRWGLVLVAVLGIALLGGIVTAVAAVTDWDGPNRHHDGVTRVVGANGEETIIVHDDRGPFFFPGILFVPLFFLLFFGFARAIFWRNNWRGPGGGGPWSGRDGGPGSGSAPPWIDEWHRKAHESDTSEPRETRSAAPEAAETSRG